MRKDRSRVLAGAAVAGLLGSMGTASAQGQGAACRMVMEEAGFALLVAVDGSAGRYQLLCRDGRLTAVPVASGPSDVKPALAPPAIDQGGPPIAIEGTSPPPPPPGDDARRPGEALPAPASSGPSSDAAEAEAARRVAGVTDLTSADAVTEAVAQPGGGAPVSSFIAGPAEDAAAKPGVTAADAAPGGVAIRAGEPKDKARIDPATTQSTEQSKVRTPGPDGLAEAKTVRVPGPVIGAARLAVPGVTFKTVSLSREEASTFYDLAGRTEAGRAVSVTVDETGRVRAVGREVEAAAVPADLVRIAQAVVPGARIDSAMQSTQENFRSFYLLGGRDAKAEPFALELRADGRSLRFIEPD